MSTQNHQDAPRGTLHEAQLKLPLSFLAHDELIHSLALGADGCQKLEETTFVPFDIHSFFQCQSTQAQPLLRVLYSLSPIRGKHLHP